MEGISIVICCYNSAKRLPETLAHIARLDGFNATWAEVVIVDNASTDDTASIAVTEWKKNNIFPDALKVVNEATPGLGSARKKGINEARFDFIIFCDDDNWLDADYLNVTAQLIKEYPTAAALGGQGIPCFESGVKPEWFDYNQGYYAVGKQADSDGIIPKLRSYVYGASSVWRKAVLEEIIASPLLVTGRKGNKLSSSDDNELCYKAIQLGYEVVYSSKLKFIHFIPASRLTLDYVRRITEESIPGAIRLHGLAYKIGINRSSFDTYMKRTWYGQVIASAKHLLIDKTKSPRMTLLMIKALIALNWRYNKLFR